MRRRVAAITVLFLAAACAPDHDQHVAVVGHTGPAVTTAAAEPAPTTPATRPPAPAPTTTTPRAAVTRSPSSGGSVSVVNSGSESVNTGNNTVVGPGSATVNNGPATAVGNLSRP